MPLIGGSSGAESNQGFTHGFFQEGVKCTQFKASKTYTGRILPAFDHNIRDKQSDEFRTSIVPYRDPSITQDFLTKTEGYTSWYYQVCGYTFLGNSNRSLLSPLSAVADVRGARGVDPVADCQNTAHLDKENGWKALTVKKDGEMNTPLPRVRFFSLMNVLLMTDEHTQETQNQIGILTSSGMDHLRQVLARRAGRNDIEISPEWAEYLLGDVTHPEQALMFHVRETMGGSGQQQIKFAGMHFSRLEDRLEGQQQWPIDVSTESGLEVLRGRYNISDDANVVKLPNYEEILDWMVSDGFLPYELVCRACGPHVNQLPPKPATRTFGSEPTNPVQPQDEPAAPAAAPTPPAPAAAPAPPSAPAAPEAVDDKFWITDPASNQVVLKSRNEITDLLLNGCQATLPAMSEDQAGGWQTLADFGFEAAAPVAAAPAPPAAPNAPAAAPAPPASSGAGLSAEEETQYQELHAKFSAGPNNLSAQDLPTYFELAARRGELQQA